MSQIKVELLDSMGDDLAVVQAARVSFAKDTEDFDNVRDPKLINYLASHDHWTPFAHTALKFRVAAPVPIRTQCFKHKVGMVENEESRRYISTTPEIFIPDFFRSKPQGSIKQGSGDKHEDSDHLLYLYNETINRCTSLYEYLIDEGVCPEQARFVLPQGAIVNWIWTGNVVSFANFYLKRTDPTAQKEVKMVAELIGEEVKSYSLFLGKL